MFVFKNYGKVTTGSLDTYFQPKSLGDDDIDSLLRATMTQDLNPKLYEDEGAMQRFQAWKQALAAERELRLGITHKAEKQLPLLL